MVMDRRQRIGRATAPLAPRSDATLPRAVLCFSHLRWGFVWQRPQHLLTRIARRLPVYLVEEPVPAPAGEPASLLVGHDHGVTIFLPRLPDEPGAEWGFSDWSNPRIRALLAPALRERRLLSGTALWYYTPMALGAAPEALDPAVVVFDAMDELAAFKGAPAALREREAALMRQADVVFAGGPSLYEARRRRRPDVHCFPSGVEAAHFAQARAGLSPAADLAALPPPVVGYYGVIDERIDPDLIAGVADRRPGWSLALVGPVVKVAPEELPNRPNIHYLGMRAYAELPAYLAGFDAAILPFARNEATRFISPTKTLEYLAGGRPVASTPVEDVVRLYGEVVEIAATAGEMVGAIERLWAEAGDARARRQATADRLLAEHDWDRIAARMQALMAAAVCRRATLHAVPPEASPDLAWRDLAGEAIAVVGEGVE